MHVGGRSHVGALNNIIGQSLGYALGHQKVSQVQMGIHKLRVELLDGNSLLDGSGLGHALAFRWSFSTLRN
jgi:hypothetical protein